MPTKKHEIETPIMRRGDACKLLKISPRSLDYLVAAKEIPHKRLSKRLLLFDRDTLLQWVREGGVQV